MGHVTRTKYDAAGRLEFLNGQPVYQFDNNGNLLTTGAMTNTFDAANRLTASTHNGTTVEPIYNGVGDWVGQTVGVTTTDFALDVAGGLPEVIYTSEGEVFLHLPGVIVTEKDGEIRYLLSDGLGSIRQAVDETATLVSYYEFDPYGNPVNNIDGGDPYGYTGEWWERYTELLYLRARWYQSESGIFLSRDPVESEPSYLYVRGNPINRVDPSGFIPRYGEAGTRQHYSCKCGWIDTGHATHDRGLIDQVLALRNSSTRLGIVSRSQPTHLTENIRLKWLQGDFVVDKQAIMGDGAYQVALGIFIAFENLFETTQSYPGFSLSKSSFSEEDLVSNLIDFHISYGQKAGVGPASLDDFMALCQVVGLEYRENNPREYITIQGACQVVTLLNVANKTNCLPHPEA